MRLRNGPAAVIPTPDGDPLGRDSATGPLKRPGKAAGAGGKSEDLPSGLTLPGRWQILKLVLEGFCFFRGDDFAERPISALRFTAQALRRTWSTPRPARLARLDLGL